MAPISSVKERTQNNLPSPPPRMTTDDSLNMSPEGTMESLQPGGDDDGTEMSRRLARAHLLRLHHEPHEPKAPARAGGTQPTAGAAASDEKEERDKEGEDEEKAEPNDEEDADTRRAASAEKMQQKMERLHNLRVKTYANDQKDLMGIDSTGITLRNQGREKKPRSEPCQEPRLTREKAVAMLFQSCGPNEFGRLSCTGLFSLAGLMGFDGDREDFRTVFGHICGLQGWDPEAGPELAQFQAWLQETDVTDEELQRLVHEMQEEAQSRTASRWQRDSGFRRGFFDCHLCLSEVDDLPQPYPVEPWTGKGGRGRATEKDAPSLASRVLPTLEGIAASKEKDLRTKGRCRSPFGREGPQWKPLTKDKWKRKSSHRFRTGSPGSPRRANAQRDKFQEERGVSPEEVKVDIRRPGWHTRAKRPVGEVEIGARSRRPVQEHLVRIEYGAGGDLGICLRALTSAPSCDTDADDCSRGGRSGPMRIVGISMGGLVQDWNAKSPASQHIRIGDTVRSVNGNPGEILEKLVPGKTLALSIGKEEVAPAEYEIQLDRRGGQRLGITIDTSGTGVVFVTGVSLGGAAQAWNETADLEHRVMPGDEIYDVHGVHTDTAKMVEELKRVVKLHVKLRRGQRNRTKMFSEVIDGMREGGQRHDDEAQPEDGREQAKDSFTSEVCISLPRPGGDLGLRVAAACASVPNASPSAAGLLVTGLAQGGAADISHRLLQGAPLGPGDVLRAVRDAPFDGASLQTGRESRQSGRESRQSDGGAAGLARALRQGAWEGFRELRLQVLRGRRAQADFSILIDRPTSSALWGISVAAGEPEELIITGIELDGVLQMWNEQHPDQQARLGDAIYEVNGVRGSGVLLEKAMRSSGQIHIRLRRTDANTRKAFSVFARAVEKRALQEAAHRPGQGNHPEVEDGIEFAIVVDRTEGDRLGIEVDSVRGWLLCVTGIAEDGLIAAWNASNRHMQVLPGDLLATVNGVPCENKPEVFEALRSPGRLRLGLRRAWLAAAGYEVELRKEMYNETRFGVDVDDSDPAGLFITGISVAGIVAEWNERNPELPLLPGDIIWSVNGVTGDGARMIGQMRMGKRLALKLLRNSEYRLARMLDFVYARAGEESGKAAEETAAFEEAMEEQMAADIQEAKVAEKQRKLKLNNELRTALGLEEKMSKAASLTSVKSDWTPTAEFDLMNFVDMEKANLDTIRLLLFWGKDVNKLYRGGSSVLHVAALRGDGDVVSLLIDEKAQVNRKDESGQTPLFFASNRDVCFALKSNGARVDMRNASKQTAAHLAARNNFEQVLAWLAENMEANSFLSLDGFGAPWWHYARLAGMEDTKIKAIKSRSYRRQ